ncbi:PREDICTED: protein FAR-RED-ELONGATED HYPOCOTYL 1-LIKE-like isoform X2 [Tarenaya hassleriana]|uniref:protein FAR-RED-ELONGATED HYPOCOTYL 1-LIKE-like isoform X2 n=1 Tax=Tarenaya hassleriana TaxID=28532 RepID=UPI00053C5605|nr:PREDICTED: protein FAR-RED-ELONGATED HYPOCOTYL 1-LIKE-like isoform X2 [Tarenaya hassleriana]
MDEDDKTNPSQIHRDISNPVVDAGSSDSGRKRKLLDGVLELPLPKHVRLEQTSIDDPCSPLDRFLSKSPETTESDMAIDHSFSGDYDFAECSNSTYESKIGKTLSDGSSPFEVICDDLASSSTDCISSKDYGKTQASQDLNQLEFLSSEFAMDGFDQLQDEDADAGSYLLSSPRLSDSSQDTREPTIDQEFEQYFSSLMM